MIRRRSPPAPTTPTRCGRPTATCWRSARGVANRRRRRRSTSCRSADPARCARWPRCQTASPTSPGPPTASGWPSPAAPAMPATRPRTSAGSPRARSRRSSPASTTRAGCSIGRSTSTSSPPTARAPVRNLTPGPHQHIGVSWLADSSGVVTSGGAPRRLGPRPVRGPLRRAPRRPDPAAHQADRDLRSPRRLAGWRRPSPSSVPTTRSAARRTTPSASSPSTAVGTAGSRPSSTGRSARRAGLRSPVWLDDDTILATAEDRGDTHLFRLTVDGSQPPEPLTRGPLAVHSFDAAAGRIAMAQADRRAPARDRHARRSRDPHHQQLPRVGEVRRADDRRHRRDRRLDHAPGGLRAAPQVPRAAQRPRRARSPSTASCSSTRPRSRRPPGSSS